MASFLGGGMINVYPSSPVILNCIFEYNTATYQGGGIYNAPNSSPTLINCTITANSSEIGGGIYSWSSSPTINNSIIWGNTATENGNQIGINSGTTTLNYSCYSNGTNDIYNSGGTFTATNNNITSDPKFVGSGEYPFLILGESPCVDAGNNTYISEDYDIRGAGYSRKLNKTTGGAGTVDMGAYEYKVNVDPLPVELSMFSAEYKMNNVILNWQTATEVNNYGFEIERSVAQISNLFNNWQKIGFVNGHGNSNSPKDYSFIDANPPSGKLQYRLKQIDTDGSFEYSQVVQVETELPKQFSLEQNYPNPFNPSTTIKYSIPSVMVSLPDEVRLSNHDNSDVIPSLSRDEVHVTLIIYNILGKEVATLVDEYQKPGTYNYQLSIDNYKLSGGVYFYQLQAGNFIATKKLILLK
ncbi:T9SS C-terminal target domain-containing protein [Bacteroidetes/Chlorobi group bacterium ChocPot_Mid]|nr:MAG: T9SS C-terminal target domain-containing protein [Bacteroidetes/Chlorobi group bacterium ChocPot_Mid]